MRKVLAAAAFVAVAMSAPGASAHGDPTHDATRCDTATRTGHTNGHHHTGANDYNTPAGYLHNHSGHYALTNQNGYLEIVGGQGYNGPDGAGGQGGWIQGEWDAYGVDIDFFVALYGPDQAELPDPEPDEDPSLQACATPAGYRYDTGKVSIPLPDVG